MGWTRQELAAIENDEYIPEVTFCDSPSWFWECSDKGELKMLLKEHCSKDARQKLADVCRVLHFPKKSVFTTTSEFPAKLRSKSTFKTRIRKLVEIAPKDLVEQRMCKQLAAVLNATREAINPAGRVDVLTKDYVIEVKTAANWKHGIGQALVYSLYYPGKKPVLFLFGDDVHIYRDVAKYHCEQLGVVYCEASQELLRKCA